MNQKLMSKSQALASMALGMRVRHILWDNPYHYGCVYAYLNEGSIWCQNTEDDNTHWIEIEKFKEEARESGWYIYELQSS